MFRSTITTALTTLAALGLAATTFAAPPKVTKPAAPAAKWASGEVERIDQAAGTLVVKQGGHELTFVLAKDAKLTEGHKTITTNELGAAVGHKAKVLYTSDGTQKTAHTVEVEVPHVAKKPAHPSK